MSPSPRRYDLDWLRVLAFGLLILYHTGMMYVAWPWHIESSHHSAALENLMLLVNQWRLPLLFLISGIAVHFLWRRVSTFGFLRLRSWRLLLPLAFGMLVVVPPQPYFELRQAGAIQPGYGEFLERYFQLGTPFFEAHFTWNHLWYLAYLWVYTLALVVLRPLLAWLRRALAARRLAGAWRPWHLVVAPALPLALAGVMLRERYPSTHALAGDWYNHAIYFTVFVYGYWLGDGRRAWRLIVAARRCALATGVLLFGSLLVALRGWVIDVPAEDWAFLRPLVYLNLWAWIVAILGFARVHLDRPSLILGRLTPAVYPFYVLHQTITVVAGYWLVGLGLGPVLEPLFVVAATFGGCWLLYAWPISRSRLLRPLFGLPARPRRPSGVRTGAAVA